MFEHIKTTHELQICYVCNGYLLGKVQNVLPRELQNITEKDKPSIFSRNAYAGGTGEQASSTDNLVKDKKSLAKLL